MKLSEFNTVADRRRAVEKHIKKELPAIAQALTDEPQEIHCENLIGATSIPLGVAGPVDVVGEDMHGSYMIPLATTEGALVASVSRGSRALREVGGARTYSYQTGTTRGPVFLTKSVDDGQQLMLWVQEHLDEVIELAQGTSSHLSLINIEAKLVGTYVFLRMYYDTQEAMGMNMVTIATAKIVEHIAQKTKTECIAVAGNFDVDKKPAWLNSVYGRGHQVWADAVLTEDVVKKTLKTTIPKLFETWLGKCMIGSAISGSMSYNAHFANVVAALYAATGQDLAHVVEGSLGITTMRIVDSKHLYISIYMPSVMAGMVGGGTPLQTKREALAIMGVESVTEYCQVLGAAVLAGEISLLASLSEGTLARAHEALGR